MLIGQSVYIAGKSDISDRLVIGDTTLDVVFDATEQEGGLYKGNSDYDTLIKIAKFESRKQCELFEETIIEAINNYTDRIIKAERERGD